MEKRSTPTLYSGNSSWKSTKSRRCPVENLAL